MAVVNNRGTQSFYSKEFEDYEEIKSMINKESLGLTGIPSKDTSLTIDEDADLFNQEDGFGVYEENSIPNLELAYMLEKASNHMDSLGLHKEADFLTYILKKSEEGRWYNCPNGNCHETAEGHYQRRFDMDIEAYLENTIELPIFGKFDSCIINKFPIGSAIRIFESRQFLSEIKSMIKSKSVPSINIDIEIENYYKKDSELRSSIAENEKISNSKSLIETIDSISIYVVAALTSFKKSYPEKMCDLVDSYNEIRYVYKLVNEVKSDLVNFKPYIDSINKLFLSLKKYVVLGSILSSINNAEFKFVTLSPSFNPVNRPDLSETKINIDKAHGHAGHGIGKEVAERFIELRENSNGLKTWHYIEKNPAFLEIYNTETLVVDLSEGLTSELEETYLSKFKKELDHYKKKIDKYYEKCSEESELSDDYDCENIIYLANSKFILHLNNNFNFGTSRVIPTPGLSDRGSLDEQYEDFAFEGNHGLLDYLGLRSYDNKYGEISSSSYKSKKDILEYLKTISNLSNKNSLSYFLINDFNLIPIYKNGSLKKMLSVKENSYDEMSDKIYRYLIGSMK